MIGIDKRRYKRIDYKLKADVTCNTKNYKAMIENFSETGIFKIVFPEKSVIDFYPEEGLEISFILPSGEEFNLNCKIKWVRIKRENPLFLKYHMGVQIIEPSPEYKEFVNDLLEKSKA
ncbi:MAG: PilZ domain-containing protein [Candidatus Hodarchaeales archaeon]|jgi:c-di-GMP-binding flagellar brake protein YcgR